MGIWPQPSIRRVVHLDEPDDRAVGRAASEPDVVRAAGEHRQGVSEIARGDLRTARQLTARAKTRFPVGSPGWVKADDIASVQPTGPRPR